MRMIVCSLGEVEAYARRAARGAGMPWGLAEEAGKATRWLAARGLPGVELLLGLLTANDRRPYASMAPEMSGGRWRATGADLCPICCGAALSDRGVPLRPGEELSLVALARPLLLAPFLDRPGGGRSGTFRLGWTGAGIRVSGHDVEVSCDDPSVLLGARSDETTLSVESHPTVIATHRPRVGSVETPISVWRALDDLGRRTYVPASAGSRERGAGAGLIDND